MKWLELDNHNFYQAFDDKQKIIRGYWLVKQKINLEELPLLFKEQFKKFDKIKSTEIQFELKKVYLDEIEGTSHKDYGDMELITAYIRLKRADTYIMGDMVTKRKYDNLLRKNLREKDNYVILSQNKNGKYFVDGNGNHRIILYKMMMYSEIATKLKEHKINNTETSINAIKEKYWLIAKIKK